MWYVEQEKTNFRNKKKDWLKFDLLLTNFWVTLCPGCHPNLSSMTDRPAEPINRKQSVEGLERNSEKRRKRRVRGWTELQTIGQIDDYLRVGRNVLHAAARLMFAQQAGLLLPIDRQRDWQWQRNRKYSLLWLQQFQQTGSHQSFHKQIFLFAQLSRRRTDLQEQGCGQYTQTGDTEELRAKARHFLFFMVGLNLIKCRSQLRSSKFDDKLMHKVETREDFEVRSIEEDLKSKWITLKA